MWCKIKDTLEPIINDWNFQIIFIYLAVIFVLIFIAYRTYNVYISPRLNPDFRANKEFESKSKKEDKQAEIYFFCVKWCPHCKKAKPEWNKVKERFHNKEINGIKIYFKDIDYLRPNEKPEICPLN